MTSHERASDHNERISYSRLTRLGGIITTYSEVVQQKVKADEQYELSKGLLTDYLQQLQGQSIPIIGNYRHVAINYPRMESGELKDYWMRVRVGRSIGLDLDSQTPAALWPDDWIVCGVAVDRYNTALIVTNEELQAKKRFYVELNSVQTVNRAAINQARQQ